MKYNTSEIKVDGLRDLQDALNELPTKINKQAWNSIFSNALRTIIRQELVNGVSDDMKKNIKIQMGKGKSNDGRMIIGIDADGYVQRFIEYGTVVRQTKKNANRGLMTPKPFIARLYFSKMEEVIKYVEKNAQELANKYLVRKLKKLNK
jgi:hypothetical protein